MLRCRVADIGAPSIARIARRKAAHDAIASHLGDDGSGGDREAEGVSVDDCLHGAIDRRGDVAVDERDVRADAEDGDGARHRQQGGAQDVDAVDFGHTRRTDPDMRGPATGASPQRTVAGLAFIDAQQLRIVEPVAQRFREAAGIENHSRGDHRPGKRPAPGLVNAADQPRAAPFDLEIRHRPLPLRLVPQSVSAGQAGSASASVSV